MTNQHPITPPPELVERWKDHWFDAKIKHINLEDYILAQAAQWGADQELEACCEWFANEGYGTAPDRIRMHRRPKPPSLKEHALETLHSMQIEPCMINGVNTIADLMAKYDILRRALEALPND